jgi:3-(3-hydroxy-phenyl)propionate hydroxylase
MAGLPVIGITLTDLSPELKSRYLGEAEVAVYLIRPDQHIVARWPDFSAEAVEHAVALAIGKAAA